MEVCAESLPLGLVRSAVCVLHSECVGLNFLMITSNSCVPQKSCSLPFQVDHTHFTCRAELISLHPVKF